MALVEMPRPTEEKSDKNDKSDENIIRRARRKAVERVNTIRSQVRDLYMRARISHAIMKENVMSDFMADNRAQMGGNNRFMEKGVNMAVGLLVVGLLAAYLLPIAISEIVGVDTSSWGSAEAQLFGLLPIFFVLGILLFVVKKAMN